MALEPAVSELEQLKERPAIASLLSWKPGAVQAVNWDRNELTIWIEPIDLREACRHLRDDDATQFISLADITSVDWYPAEPRFEMVYSLLSHKLKERIRLKVKLSGQDPNVESLASLWPGASPFEREVYDLMGIRFQGHPDLRRIMMPDDWEGHPLRKDYPVEGYR
jgi:NADH-quinone oxidoreductase subunit C